jgi:hypothetical protein
VAAQVPVTRLVGNVRPILLSIDAFWGRLHSDTGGTKWIVILKIIWRLWFDFVFFIFVLQAYVYTKASKIIGVEMNADLCNIQNNLIKKYNFQVPIRFIGRGSDMYSDILSHKLAPSSNFFSFWKKTR